MSDYLVIGYGQTAMAGLLIFANLVLSVALRLGLGRRLLVASLRMSVQLLLVGFALEWIFSLRTPGPVLLMGLAMAAIAGIAAVNRTRRRFAGVYWESVVSVIGSAMLVTGIGVVGIIRVEPWYEPQYFIPLLGMVLGNTLTGISLGLDRFMEALATRRGVVETTLALGGSRWEAAHPEIREALRTAMVPTLNSMLVMGVVSLPGMMTGQILAGADPIVAVRYQVVIMFMIASGAALGAFGVVLLAFRSLFDVRHRLRVDRLRDLGESA